MKFKIVRNYNEKKREEDVVLKTAYYPKNFKLTCETLSSSKRNDVVQMGFGPLMEMGCIKLNRNLCQMFVDNLDGIYLSINVTEFERVMGVRNNGTRVELGCANVNDTKELRRKLCGENEDISVDNMKQIIVAREEADDVFKSFFVMYTLVVLLCPNTTYTVDMRFLVALSDASSIGNKNWASLCFRHLLDGVVAYKNNRNGYMSGCMVFLQVFYFDAVRYSSFVVCKLVLPVVALTSKKCKQMTKWVIGEGGFHSTFVNVGNIIAAEFGGSEAAAVFPNYVDVTVSDDMLRVMHEIDSLQNEVDRLKSVMYIMEANMEKFSSMFTEIEMISHDMTKVGLRRRFLYAVRNVFGSGMKSSLNLDNDVEVNLNDGIGKDTEMLRQRPLSPIFDDEPNETVDVAVDAGDNGFGIETDDHPVGNDKIGFLLEGKMSPGDFKLLKFVFDEPHIGADKSSEVVARYGELVLSKAEIECMRPENTITSKVM
ncbi:hypothetical protein ACLB2K_041609 [Fragaria x ananassa]